mmetsp:Transcript_21541/g.27860  ORF Transcript_21541/g.27860 Transcript_21541/m.27860 type:complete len:208 (-) Transcript_21541:115-738(-)
MSSEEKTPDEPKEAVGTGEVAVPAAEEESTATFEPVVKLEEVEIQSGEEDEEVVYAQRSKLFIFGETMLDKGSGNKTWIERGIGNLRVLRHKEHKKLRLLMRQEKTMKIICNHVIDPRIKLEPHVQSDRAWIWAAFDFSGGTELVETIFCIKFGDSEVANKYKVEFEGCQEKMKELVATDDAETGDAAADAAADTAADKLAALTTDE